MQDPEIISRILKNDHAAFEQLINKYQNLVYSTCFRLLKNQADAEDLSQEVFLEVFRSLVHLKNVEDMSGWIYRISYGKCISYIRKKNPAKASRGDKATLARKTATNTEIASWRFGAHLAACQLCSASRIANADG